MKKDKRYVHGFQSWERYRLRVMLHVAGSPGPNAGSCTQIAEELDAEMLENVINHNEFYSSFRMDAANPLNPFAMCTAFPCSDYYGSSAPSRQHQPTTDLPGDRGPSR